MPPSKQTVVSRKKERMRNALWPEVQQEALWHRKTSDGWVTLPRAFPLILRIMDTLAPKGKPVSATYLELWCRTYDDSFVVASRPREMAFYAGFTGERAQHTWMVRVRELVSLGFVRIAEGTTGPAHYILLLNPYHVIKQHIDAGQVQPAIAHALMERMIEIGADDLDADDGEDDLESETEE